ncbi:MAG: cob(I)yrinic acid a,c-diamide adenosyltransferase [Pseudomonadota bacterium]|uniref:cob(I)yrinic acid a,c-diamide adenosyltransferase n=1 Tax=Rhizorhabdus phycosphaerae TaxID=2711156 RepID=UPI0013EA2B2B|nr:cob(I)yrinic acid a,c-diamide adenosyltransferase [Rhizorhabdus phycosphaerae]
MKARTDEEHKEKMVRLQAAQERKIAGKTVEKGLIVVHTGTGKGKTSAALGMVIRAIGHGMKVGVIQFVKGAMGSGEKVVFDQFPELVEFKPMGEGFTWDTQDRSRDIEVARAGWDEVKRMIADPTYKLVLADELNIVLRYGYLPVEEVIEVLRTKPPMTHVIVTGRNAPQPLIDMADLVTDMTLVKHPFRDQNVRAQPGIEY